MSVYGTNNFFYRYRMEKEIQKENKESMEQIVDALQIFNNVEEKLVGKVQVVKRNMKRKVFGTEKNGGSDKKSRNHKKQRSRNLMSKKVQTYQSSGKRWSKEA